MQKSNKTLIAGPFIGELGWEVFAWSPLVRAIFDTNGYKQCVVYTRPGRRLLYPFAETVVGMEKVPEHEAECMAWHGLGQEESLKADLNQLISQVAADAKGRFGEDVDVFSYGNMKELNNPYFEKGSPILLTGNANATEADVRETLGLPENGKPVTFLCVRDREMTQARNWKRSNWEELAASLAETSTVIVMGRSEYAEWNFPDGVFNILNQTTIDDCINIFANIGGLAVGGSTGLLHLASRCAIPHLVWGTHKHVIRYAETNWFGAPYAVYTWGWDPHPQNVLQAVLNYHEDGEFANENE